jgi:hypothetical protein
MRCITPVAFEEKMRNRLRRCRSGARCFVAPGEPLPEESTMRFMIMHKMTVEMENRFPPDPAIIEGVGRLIGAAMRDKIFLGGAGLKPSSQRMHVAYKNGERTLTEGPFKDPKQLVAGYAILKVRSKDEALGWLDKFAALLGDVELFMGPVVEAWDLGATLKPENAPLRFLSMHQADARSESETPPDPKLMEKMGVLVDEMTKAGVLEETGGLASTKKGARVRFDGGKRTVIDGPFAESKELVAGFAILELPSKAAAVEWASEFGDVVRVNEVEIREIPEW